MSGDRLTALQWRILVVLAGIEPGWTLTGGAALAGFYLDGPQEILVNKLCALLG
jgi:hypothetical protein